MYLKSAFVISLATYVLLIMFEVVQPGLVSNYFSAHWLLLISLLLFVVMFARDYDIGSHKALEWVVVSILALIFAVATWSMGRPLEELRILITLIAATLPFCLFSSLKHS